MERRTFLRLLGLTSVFYPRLLQEAWAEESAVVAVAEGKDYAQITRNAIDALGGIKRFVRKGNIVVVKPNIGWDRSPEQGANTHPLVVRSVVQECLRAGAKKVKIFDRTCNDERRCYVNSGIAAALKGMEKVS
jgi:uncharacterized protein (DUF362 family)